MRFCKQMSSQVCCCLAVLSLLTGCDQIKAFKEKVLPSPKNKQAASQPQVIQKIENVVPPATQQVQPPLEENAPLPEGILAQVGDWKLSLEEFNERLASLRQAFPDFDPNSTESKKLILDELIRQQLLVVAAQKQGLAQKKEITAAIEDFKRTLLVQEVANQLTKDILVTEAEAKEYYEKNKQKLMEPIQRQVREIMVYTEAVAKDILVRLLQGADFAAIAKAESKNKSAADSGLLPLFVQAPFSQMATAIATLNKGETSNIFKGPDGHFYIVKLEDIKGGETKPFEEIKDQLVSGLTLQKQQQAVLSYLNELSTQTSIKINEDLLGNGVAK